MQCVLLASGGDPGEGSINPHFLEWRSTKLPIEADPYFLMIQKVWRTYLFELAQECRGIY